MSATNHNCIAANVQELQETAAPSTSLHVRTQCDEIFVCIDFPGEADRVRYMTMRAPKDE